VKQHALEGERDVTQAAKPLTALAAALHGKRDGDFELAARADAMLVNDFVREFAPGALLDGGREQRLVLGKRLLCDQGSRKIQLTARPVRVVAEVADIGDSALELSFTQRIAKRGHPPAECADRTAFVGDRKPVRRHFRRIEAAVGEVRQRWIVEADLRQRGAFAVCAVTRGARRTKDLLAGAIGLPGLRCGRIDDNERGERARTHDDPDSDGWCEHQRQGTLTRALAMYEA
jgi:hypothetical protein